MTEQEPRGSYVIPRIGWGARLRAAREDVAHMDQRSFAESIGMTHGTYGGHEKRIAAPRGARLIANSVELRWRVPAEWLLAGPELPQKDSNFQPTDLLATVLPFRRTGGQDPTDLPMPIAS